MVMIGSNSRKVHINQLQPYHTGIQEKEKREILLLLQLCVWFRLDLRFEMSFQEITLHHLPLLTRTIKNHRAQ